MNEKIVDYKGEPNFIAYIDILGYKNMINDKENWGIEKVASIIHDCIKYANEKSYHNNALVYTYGPDYYYTINQKVFSDNLFFCTKDAWLALIYLVDSIQNTLLRRGILTRGALCYGEIYYSNVFICGSGLVHAYELENEIAIYPRAIIDNSFINAISVVDLYRSRNEIQQYLEKNSYVRIDSDGYIFIDYLWVNKNFDTQNSLNKIRTIIIKGIDTITNLRIQQKYKWLKNYYNKYCMENEFIDFTIF